MKECDVPVAFELDLGYRKLKVEAGKRYYSEEVANAMPQFVVEEPPAKGAAKEPDSNDEPHARSKRS
jgi:hypothetical protein